MLSRSRKALVPRAGHPCKSQAVRLWWGPLAPFPCSSPIPCPILLKRGPPRGADDSQICVSPLRRMLHSRRDRSLFLANDTSGPLGEGAALASGSVLSDGQEGRTFRGLCGHLCSQHHFQGSSLGVWSRRPTPSAPYFCPPTGTPEIPGAWGRLSSWPRHETLSCFKPELTLLSSGWENPVVSQVAKLLPGQSDTPEEQRRGRNQSVPISEPQIGPKCIPQTPSRSTSPLGSHDHWRVIRRPELRGPRGLLIRFCGAHGPGTSELLWPLGNTRAYPPILQM